MRLPHGIRSAGARLLGGVPVPVLSGPNAGRLWSLASAGRGYVSGRFEAERVSSILAMTRPGDDFWDIGAHKGYVALAAARRVGSSGRVRAFEPSRYNLEFLRRHVAWNRARNIEVHDVAIAEAPGESSFGGGGSSIAFRLGGGDERVRVRTVMDLVEESGRPPDVLKVDVEGAEARVLAGAGEWLPRIGALFVAVHGPGPYEECTTILEGAGLRVMESAAMRRYTERGARWSDDADLLAWSRSRDFTPDAVASLPAFAPPA